jgi:hypothetical protein
MTLREWTRVADEVLAAFVLDGETYRHARLDRIRTEQHARTEERAESGKRGAEARWREEKDMAEPCSKNGSASKEPMATDASSARASSSSSATAVQRTFSGSVSTGPHRGHAVCGRVCVPALLHDRFRGKLGGTDSDRRLRVWYGETLDAIPDETPIAEQDFKFWETRFAAWVKVAASNAAMDALERELDGVAP